MKVYKSGKINPNALNELETINFNKNIEKLLLTRLDHLLKTIDANTSDTMDKFVQNLHKLYDTHLDKVELVDHSQHMQGYFDRLKYLKQFPKLANKSVNLYIQLLDLAENVVLWSDNPIQTCARNSFRSFLVPEYISLEALTNTIDRKQAISIHKKYVTDYYYTYEPKNPNFVDITTAIENIKTVQDDEHIPWEMYYVILSESKYAFRNNNCLWIDSLTDFPDPEIKYQICCYGDYEKAQIRRNEHMILTMEHTIAQGDPYCSRVLHDTRGDWHLKHPDKGFWDSIDNQKES